MYYLQSRYYDPEIGRFINGDGLATTGQGLLGNNMFAYCANNAVCHKDEHGTRYCAATSVQEETAEERSQACQHQNKIARNKKTKSKVLRDIADGAITYYSAVAWFYGGWRAFCLVNNATNFIYYSFLSSGESSLESNDEMSSYTNTYITRWDRLDYVKQQTGDSIYGCNAWRYNGEYSMHMYAWYALQPFSKLGIGKIDAYIKSAEKIHIEAHANDPNIKTRVVTYLFGLLGL